MTSPPGTNPPAARTGIIRRAPTGAFPAATGNSIPSAGFADSPPPGTDPSAAVPITACAVAILSGWATSVVATDLLASWWRTDRLFCVAVGFLTLVFALATITGVILLLRQRSLGGHLIAVGAMVALLTFGSLFIAGARVPSIVHVIPVLQVASAALALHPASRRWARSTRFKAW